MPSKKKKLSEFNLIKKIKNIFPENAKIYKGIGDDCAVIKEGKTYYLYTIDNMVEGIHFDISLGMDYCSVGYKSVIRSISDIVAMGGKPKFFLLNLLVPDNFNERDLDLILQGIKNATLKYKLALIGGDISLSKTLTITISAVGITNTKPILRSGAKIGDYIYYTGNLGMASSGLEFLRRNIKYKKTKPFIEKLLRPELKNNFSIMLAKNKLASAMIDISDGFLGDLSHILEESNCGAIIYENFLEKNTFDIYKNFFKKEDIHNFILNGGDEYELIFTSKKEDNEKIQSLAKKFKFDVNIAGEIIDKGLFLLKNSKKISISPRSYEHKFET